MVLHMNKLGNRSTELAKFSTEKGPKLSQPAANESFPHNRATE